MENCWDSRIWTCASICLCRRWEKRTHSELIRAHKAISRDNLIWFDDFNLLPGLKFIESTYTFFPIWKLLDWSLFSEHEELNSITSNSNSKRLCKCNWWLSESQSNEHDTDKDIPRQPNSRLRLSCGFDSIEDDSSTTNLNLFNSFINMTSVLSTFAIFLKLKHKRSTCFLTLKPHFIMLSTAFDLKGGFERFELHLTWCHRLFHFLINLKFEWIRINCRLNWIQIFSRIEMWIFVGWFEIDSQRGFFLDEFTELSTHWNEQLKTLTHNFQLLQVEKNYFVDFSCRNQLPSKGIITQCEFPMLHFSIILNRFLRRRWRNIRFNVW